jgi:NADP-dependent 3-hydroxy acid dehydrogenase YdfG
VSTLSEQLAVVTGGTSGIGRAIALALAAQGTRLAVIGRRLEALEAVRAQGVAAGIEVRAYQADVSCEAELHECGASIRRELGDVDILVHSAGIHLWGSLADASSQDFDVHYRTNVLAPYVLTQMFLPSLLRRQGQVVFVNSSAGLAARANIGQFAATKHALKAIADSLREEVNRHGVRVLSVFPGRTASPNQQRVHEFEGRPYHPERLAQPGDVAAIIMAALLLPRTAEVTEIKIRPLANFQ